MLVMPAPMVIVPILVMIMVPTSHTSNLFTPSSKI